MSALQDSGLHGSPSPDLEWLLRAADRACAELDIGSYSEPGEWAATMAHWLTERGVSVGGSCPPAPSPTPRPEELTVASANVAFLKAYPEYQDVYSWGILTTRLPGEGFEHYRYAADLLGLDRGSPRPTGESGAAESGGR